VHVVANWRAVGVHVGVDAAEIPEWIITNTLAGNSSRGLARRPSVRRRRHVTDRSRRPGSRCRRVQQNIIAGSTSACTQARLVSKVFRTKSRVPLDAKPLTNPGDVKASNRGPVKFLPTPASSIDHQFHHSRLGTCLINLSTNHLSRTLPSTGCGSGVASDSSQPP
jgi:hypothetical protein